MGDPSTSGQDWNQGANGDDWSRGFNAGASDFENANNEFGSQDARVDVGESNQMPGGCFNCGEEGHMKAECPNPRKFTGTCRECDEEGHQAKDCPNKVKTCKQCLQEGHETIDCKNPKVIDMSQVPDMSEQEAWAMLKKASDEKDLDDFRDGVKILSKAVPTMTYVDMEKEFRKRDFKVYLIGLVKNIEETWTIVNLQGEIDKKYSVGYFLSEKPQRPKLVSVWPDSPDANLERLADAGLAVDRGVSKCHNCGQMGHTKRACKEEAVVATRVTVSCKLCGEEGHRVRDCKQERNHPREPRACKVCESTDHLARDCPEKPKRTCHKCGSEEHMAKDCEVIKCRNCDAIGHESRDCSAPKDWSRVKCRNCGEMGHTVKRCKEPIKADENEGFGNGGFDNGGFDNDGFAGAGTGGGNNDWETSAKTGASGHNEWETAPASGGNEWESGATNGGVQW